MKAELLSIIDDAVAGGWTAAKACMVLGLDRQRAWRWYTRRQAGLPLEDQASGGNPVHGLLDWEQAEILALFEEWADIDRSHRKLAHRGSYENRVWVSPSTVDRVLARHNMRLAGQTRPPKTVKTPWPAWAEWEPNQLWCWDSSQFERCDTSKYAYGIIDLVSRKWITVTLTPEPNTTSVKVLFLKALTAEDLLTPELQERLAEADTPIPDDDDSIPMLLAISDNGTEMRGNDTRKFMALMSIAQHFGRPSTPTDQAWIETLWGHLKWEHPHLLAITDPAVLIAELERLRHLYNGVRLHEAIGYVTPNDEHEGRGETIRAARTAGLKVADEQRRHWHRTHRDRP